MGNRSPSQVPRASSAPPPLRRQLRSSRLPPRFASLLWLLQKPSHGPKPRLESLRMATTQDVPASDNRLVWYAGYGSNLLRHRFELYIKGGKPQGSTKEYAGCRDKTAPQGDQEITLQGELYFADRSTGWEAAVAFIRPTHPRATTYGRMFLITYGQFNDVFRQENGKRMPGAVIVPPYEQLTRATEWQIEGVRLYGRMMKIGTQGEYPILTFSATRNDFVIGAPSEAYIQMIVAGLEETYPCMLKSAILEYLGHADGIRDKIPADVLTRWILGNRVL
jgi:hypothetical protein